MIALTLSTLFALGLAACTKETPAQLPAGPQLVSEAAAAMRAVNSAHVTIDTEGQVGSLPLKSAEGDLTRSGDAKGTIKLVALSALLEVEFVVVGPDYYIKGLSGGWQKQTAADVATFYDPSAILDPDRGVAKILSTATNATTEATETVNGVDTYRVAVTFDSSAVATVVPGVPVGITGLLWLDQASKRLVKAVLTVPAATGEPGKVTIGLSNYDVPVTISAPV